MSVQPPKGMWVFHTKLKPKARPRVTRRGFAYLPRGYVQWMQMFCEQLQASDLPRYLVRLHKKHGLVYIDAYVCVKGRRRADADNMMGGLWDALQRVSGVNDRYYVGSISVHDDCEEDIVLIRLGSDDVTICARGKP